MNLNAVKVWKGNNQNFPKKQSKEIAIFDSLNVNYI